MVTQVMRVLIIRHQLDYALLHEYLVVDFYDSINCVSLHQLMNHSLKHNYYPFKFLINNGKFNILQCLYSTTESFCSF